MLFAWVDGLGFVKFISLDGGISFMPLFTFDVKQATRWNTEQTLINDINGSFNVEILRIDFV